MVNVAVGGPLGAAVVTASATSVWVDVAPADPAMSSLDDLELVCAPPELCTIPERGSSTESSLGEVVELAWASTELCETSVVESDEEGADEADELVADVGPVDDGLASDFEDELDADDEDA